MSVVQVFVSTAAGTSLTGVLDTELLKKHSQLATEVLEDQPKSIMYEITLCGAAPAAVKFILEKMRSASKRRPFFLNTKDFTISRVAAIHQAAMVLKLQPEQKGLQAHVMGWVAHHIPSPAELVSLHLVYKDGQGGIWRAMVHQIAYCIVGESVAVAKSDELGGVARGYPELDAAVRQRIAELRANREFMVRREKVKKGKRGGKGGKKAEEAKEVGGEWEEGEDVQQRAVNEAEVDRIMRRW